MKHEIIRLAEAMAVAMAGEKDAAALIEARAALETEVESLTAERDALTSELELARIKTYCASISEIAKERDALAAAARLALDALEGTLCHLQFHLPEDMLKRYRGPYEALKAVLK